MIHLSDWQDLVKVLTVLEPAATTTTDGGDVRSIYWPRGNGTVHLRRCDNCVNGEHGRLYFTVLRHPTDTSPSKGWIDDGMTIAQIVDFIRVLY